MKTAAKITGLLVGIFLVYGFIAVELLRDPVVAQIVGAPLLIVVVLVAVFGVRRILRTARANH